MVIASGGASQGIGQGSVCAFALQWGAKAGQGCAIGDGCVIKFAGSDAGSGRACVLLGLDNCVWLHCTSWHVTKGIKESMPAWISWWMAVRLMDWHLSSLWCCGSLASIDFCMWRSMWCVLLGLDNSVLFCCASRCMTKGVTESMLAWISPQMAARLMGWHLLSWSCCRLSTPVDFCTWRSTWCYVPCGVSSGKGWLRTDPIKNFDPLMLSGAGREFIKSNALVRGLLLARMAVMVDYRIVGIAM